MIMDMMLNTIQKKRVMNKVIENGLVAVLYSPGYGAGWSTWNLEKELNETLLFHPSLVEMVRNNRQDEIDED